MREKDSDFQLRQKAREGDPFKEEVISYIIRTVRPFSDRDVVLRRWQLEIPAESGRGIALVATSQPEDSHLLPAHPDRVRARILRQASLLRSMQEGGPGVEMVSCQQADISGGIAPVWAQRWLSTLAVKRSQEWAAGLREHCRRQHERRLQERRAAQEASIGEEHCNDEGMCGQEVLTSILGIEQRCLCKIYSCRSPQAVSPPSTGSQFPQPSSGPQPEVRSDDPIVMLSEERNMLTVYMKMQLDDLYPADVWGALLSEYRVIQKARSGDITQEEVVAYSLRAPQPLSDRDTTQRRWTLPLPRGEGKALVSRSVEDRPASPRQVRVFVHCNGYLLRPLQEGSFDSRGLELTVIQELGLGVACPEEAEEKLTQWATDHGRRWAADLMRYCNHRRAEGEARAARQSPPGRLAGDGQPAWLGLSCGCLERKEESQGDRAEARPRQRAVPTSARAAGAGPLSARGP